MFNNSMHVHSKQSSLYIRVQMEALDIYSGYGYSIELLNLVHKFCCVMAFLLQQVGVTVSPYIIA
jgi:hypothetical protein